MTCKNLLLLLPFLLLSPEPAWGKDEKLNEQSLLARHLESIGTAEARARWNTTLAIGKSQLKLIQGGSGEMMGTGNFASDGNKLSVLMHYGRPDYPREHFYYDGEKVETAYLRPGARSPLSQFIYTYDEIMQDGLVGGALSTAWPFLQMEGTDKLPFKYRGLKKVDGERLHEIDFNLSKGGGDIRIKMYFSPETHRHVQTIYSLTISSGIGSSPDQSSQLRNTYTRLRERFGGFQEVDGLTLPTSWNLEFSSEGERSLLWKWDVQLEKLHTNQAIDPIFYDHLRDF